MDLKLVINTTIEFFLSKLKPNSSVGQDRINNIIIKNCFPAIIDVLVYLVNLSISNGIVAPPLKTSRVVPIFKEGLKMTLEIIVLYHYHLGQVDRENCGHSTNKISRKK